MRQKTSTMIRSLAVKLIKFKSGGARMLSVVVFHRFEGINVRQYSAMSFDIECYFETALELTKQAGKLVRDRIFQIKTVETKSSDIDFVTETDKQVEKLLIDGLSKQFPDHKFIGEETASAGARNSLTSTPTWIIDPVDGTLNFVHGFPHSCISIGLFINCQPAVGIIYNPVLEQLFTAKKGQGAYYNGKRIHVSGQTDLTKAIIMMESGTSRNTERFNCLRANQEILVPIIHGIRSLGSAALNMAMVAMGAAEAYFEFDIHVWDMAAGEIIVTEAGGVVYDPAGGPIDHMSRRVLCASSQALAEQLIQKLVQFYAEPRDD